jgi:hypothetical protein
METQTLCRLLAVHVAEYEHVDVRFMASSKVVTSSKAT